MQAVILVGGEGTRLRPLTSTVPKPVVPLVDRPFIAYMLEWLRRHGVDDVVMSCGFLATSVRNVLGDGSAYGLRLRFVEEPEPRGTGGALKFAESLLDERFLMLNGDVLLRPRSHRADRPARAHRGDGNARARARRGPECVRPRAAQRRRLGARVRREAEPRPDRHEPHQRRRIRARALDRAQHPTRPQRLDRARGVAAAGRQGLYGYAAQSYWLDIGTPARYLQGTFDILEGNVHTAVQERLGTDFLAIDESAQIEGRVIPPAVIERGCRIEAGAHVGSLVVLADGVTVGSGTSVERSVVLNGAEIGRDCTLRDCIVAAGVRIGRGTQISGGAVLGEGVTLGAENIVTRGARIFPGVTLPDGALRF